MNKEPAVIQALQKRLGVRCDYSNWWIARELLRVQWKRKPAVLRDTSSDLREPPYQFMQASRDILWRRALTPDMVGKWVHHFDKNSQYLAAGRGVKTGYGNPVHLTENIVPGLPGIYRVKVREIAEEYALWGKTFPHVIDPEQEWVTSDVAIFAMEHGYEVEFLEAWVFPDYCKVLDEWSKKIWETRQFFNPKLNTVPGLTPEVQAACYAEMKDIALCGNGSWATGKDKMWDKESLDLIHPNWWADVKGKARVNILANLLKYGSPVLIKTDGLWFVTRDENPRAAVPGILDRMNECGGYKHEGSFRLTPELHRQAIGMGFTDLSTLFKHTAGEKHDTKHCPHCQKEGK